MSDSLSVYLLPVYVNVKQIAFPSEDEIIDVPSAIAIIDRQRTARIVRATSYVFATLATAATIVLTEGRLITWPVALPIIGIAVIAWGVFWWINRLDEKYIIGLTDDKRKQIAANELQKLLFDQKVGAFDNEHVIKQSFENINKLLSVNVIGEEFIQKLIQLKNNASDEDKNLLELAEEQQVSLNISFKEETTEAGWFGRKPTLKKVEAQWSGKRDEPIVIMFTREIHVEKAEEEENP